MADSSDPIEGRDRSDATANPAATGQPERPENPDQPNDPERAAEPRQPDSPASSQNPVEAESSDWVAPAAARAQRVGGWFTVVGAALLIVFFGIQTSIWWDRGEWLWVALGIFIILIDLALIVQFFTRRAGERRRRT